MATVDEESRDKKYSMHSMFVDIKKARLSGKVRDDQFVYVSLPEELYGTRPAASAWAARAGEAFKRECAKPTGPLSSDG